MNTSRRHWIRALGTIIATGTLAITSLACKSSDTGTETKPVTESKSEAPAVPIKIGILHSLSGTMAISETNQLRRPRRQLALPRLRHRVP